MHQKFQYGFSVCRDDARRQEKVSVRCLRLSSASKVSVRFLPFETSDVKEEVSKNGVSRLRADASKDFVQFLRLKRCLSKKVSVRSRFETVHQTSVRLFETMRIRKDFSTVSPFGNSASKVSVRFLRLSSTTSRKFQYGVSVDSLHQSFQYGFSVATARRRKVSVRCLRLKQCIKSFSTVSPFETMHDVKEKFQYGFSV